LDDPIRAERVMKLSRHARNNIRLYKIELRDILLTIRSPDQTVMEGNRNVALRTHPNRFSGYPLKVVYEQSGEDITIITAYPLKKKHWR
jgi:hypothetical protein